MLFNFDCGVTSDIHENVMFHLPYFAPLTTNVRLHNKFLMIDCHSIQEV